MNRTCRMKSQLGKARLVGDRRRSDQEYHQLLIGEYMAERGSASAEAPARVVRSGFAARFDTGPAAATVRVLEPASSHVPEPGGGAPAIIPFRTPGANPAVAGKAPTAAAVTRRFRWRAVGKGFLLAFVPGLILLLVALLAW